MKVCSLAMLLLLVASSATAQHAYTEKQVIEYAKSIDVKLLDTSLSSQRLEDWLQSGPPHAQVLFWEMYATCQLKPDDPSVDYPLCAEARVRRNGQFGFVIVQIGTFNRGITGSPSIYGIGVEETWEILTGSSERLSDLPGILDKPAFTGEARKLYEEIVARHPIGIPTGNDKAAIWPLLSKRLIAQLQTAQACQEEYFLQHQTADGTPKPAWPKMGIFSGDGKRALPVDLDLGGKISQDDGSSLIDVGLELPDNAPDGWWRVAARVIPENGQFVVDDVRLFDGSSAEGPSHLLSESFAGCDGPHWTGLTATNRRQIRRSAAVARMKSAASLDRHDTIEGRR